VLWLVLCEKFPESVIIPIEQRYIELFKSSKGEMMTAMRQRTCGLAPRLDSYSMYSSVGQVSSVSFSKITAII
jgi:hypothetical protein